MKKLLLLFMAVIALAAAASAQSRTVTGTVVGAEDDEPLVGATVTPVGGGQATATNIDGHFSLTVPAGVKELNVTYIGMHPATVPATDGMTVKMVSSANRLDEVMVVAYGTTNRSSYTGSAAVVGAEQIGNLVVTDVTSALNGTVAGVQLQSYNGAPGEEPKVLIRGVGSINASTNPLYVVDGIPYDGGITSINPQDVASMTVLKDAASAALYGARGANGVILITTKRGQAGPAKVTFDARWGANSRQVSDYETISDIPTYYQQYYKSRYNYAMDATGNGDFAWQWANGLGQRSGMVQGNGTNNIFGYQMWTIPTGEGLFMPDGSLNPNATLGYRDEDYDFYLQPDDWKKGTYRNGFRQEYNLAVSGGGDRFNYMVSASYLTDDGVIAESNYERLSTRATIEYQAKSWLRLGTNLAYTYENSNKPYGQTEDGYSGNAFYTANYMGPMYPMFLRDAAGNIKYDETSGHPLYDFGMKGLDGMPMSRTFLGGANPTGTLIYDKREYLHDVFNGKWFAQITPIESLKLTGTIGYWTDWMRYNSLGNNLHGQMAMYGGNVTQETTRNRSINLQVLANYTKTFADVHNLDVLLGYESYDLNIADLWGQGETIYSNDNYTLSNVIDNLESGGSIDKYATRGIFGRVNYDYDNKYFGSVSYRRDASSRFAKDHRWGNFWSVSAAWNIAKEKFMEPFTAVDLLKFKASFGQQGNDNLATSTSNNWYAWADQYKASGSNGLWSVGPLDYKGNPNLTWETSNNFNVGFDFSFFNSRLMGSLEYFQRQTHDMLYYKPVAPSLGYSSMPMNIGSMRNNGIELDLTGTVFRNKDVEVSLNANLTWINNKVLSLAPELNGTWINGSRIFKEGKSMYQIYTVKYAGVDPENGDALYWAKRADGTEEKTNNWSLARNGDGDQYVENRCESGNLLPPVYGGFGANVTAYGFDFAINCGFQAGGKMVDYGYQTLMNGAGSSDAGMALHQDLLNAWTPENPNTDVPRLIWAGNQSTYMSALSDRWLISSNYFSINNITVGYTLPKSVTDKMHLTTLRVYFSGDNLYLWSKRKGLDPRQSYTSSYAGSYSAMRCLSGGIRLEF